MRVVSGRLPYLRQADDFCCIVVAILNAARHFGLKTSGVEGPEWERLVDLAGCRHGSAVRPSAVAAEFGLELVDTTEVVPPTIVTVGNPEKRGSSLHAVLAIAQENDGLTLVNYRYRSGPLVEEVPRKILGDVQPHLRRMRAVVPIAG